MPPQVIDIPRTDTKIYFEDTTQCIVVACNPKLYSYVKELYSKGLQDVSILQVAKLWSEIKSLLNPNEEKEKENVEKS